MILRGYGVPPVYRLRASGALDSYGDPVDGWDAPTRVRLVAAEVQADSSEEDDGVTRRILTSRKRLFAPGSVDLRADDRIEHEGAVYRIDDEPVVRRSLAGSVYTTAALVRMT